jgi:hypothetical protein
MVCWVHLANEWLKAIYRQIKDQMMKGSYLQVDETPIRYLDPGKGKTGLGYLWVAYRRAKRCSLNGTPRHGIEAYTYLRDVLTRLPSMTNRQRPRVCL